MKYTYYHNPKCSKSRLGLEFIQNLGIEFTIKEYLKEEMTGPEVLSLFTKLHKEPLEIIRQKEGLFNDLGLKDKKLSAREWAQIIVENPKLLERPILVGDEKAAIGRPTEDLKKAL
jgi:arsenate reductase